MRNILLTTTAMVVLSLCGADARNSSNNAGQTTVTTNPCAQGNAYVDGCPASPAGTPQLPGILAGYAKRPPWNVAGVDYHVGVPAGTVLSPANTASLPSGCTYSATGSTNGNAAITCSSGNPTLNAINFGVNNGVQLRINGTNATVKNSLFTVGSAISPNQPGMVSVSGSANTTFLNNEFNGNNLAVTSQGGQTINIASNGTTVFKYNYLHNSGGDMIDFSGGTQNGTVILYNVFADIGVNTAHSDALQWYQTTANNNIISFNLRYQSINGTNGQGTWATYAEGGSGVAGAMNNLMTSNNTVIELAACSVCNWALVLEMDDAFGGTSVPVGVNATMHDEYIDPTGSLNYTGIWMYPNATYGSVFPTPSVVANIVNMKTGVAYTTYPAAQGRTVVPDANGYTPPMNDVYSITPSPATGTVLLGNPVTLTLNMDEPWAVTGGTPTLAMNTGHNAAYTGGSGTASLTFNYTVQAGDSASPLGVTGLATNGATIKDSVGNTATFAGLSASFTGLSVNGAGGVAPGQVTGLTAGTPGTNTMPLSWNVPAGTTPFTYTEQYSLHGANSWTPTSGISGTSYTVTGLAASTSYDFEVDATNAYGTGGFSSIVTASTAAVTGAPGNTVAPAVTSGTGFFSAGNTLTTTTGTWTNSPTSYTYQWYRNGVAITGGATAATYTIGPPDIGTTLSATVTATNGSGSTPAGSGSTATIAGWPGQPTNPVGYTAYPGYNASVFGKTAWPGGGFSSGTVGSPVVYTGYLFTGSQTINCNYCQFIQCDFNSGTGGVAVSGDNVKLIGSRFQSNATGYYNVLSSGTNLTYSYDSVTPLASFATSPPGGVWPSASSGTNTTVQTAGVNALGGTSGYQYGIRITSGGPLTIDHTDFWGFGNDGPEFHATTAQMTVTNNWIHDAVYAGTLSYHTDGTGYVDNTQGPNNVLLQANTIASLGNANAIAFQTATSGYVNLQMIGNYLSGFGNTLDPGHGSQTNTLVKNNVFGTDVNPIFGPLYGSWTGNVNGNVWKCNRIAFRPGTTWNPQTTSGINWAPTAGMDGQFWVPGSTPNSATDYSGNAVCP